MIKMVILGVALVTIEAFYYSAGGRLAYYFSPLGTLQASAFVGLLWGPAKAVCWGAGVGFLEDAYFASDHSAVGLTSIVYLWTGWMSGRFFYGRADINNPAMGAIATLLALAGGLTLAKVLSLAFHTTLPAIPSAMTWGRFFSLTAQVALGPILLRLMAWVFPPQAEML